MNLQVRRDIVPIGDLKVHAASLLKQAREARRPIVITQHGRPAGVLLSPGEYDRLTEKLRFLEKLCQGLADSSAGRVHTHEEVMADVEAVIAGYEAEG